LGEKVTPFPVKTFFFENAGFWAKKTLHFRRRPFFFLKQSNFGEEPYFAMQTDSGAFGLAPPVLK